MVAQIEAVTCLPEGLSALETVAVSEGYDFVTRLVRDWSDGSNRFDRPGEVLLAARSGNDLVGVGGLNSDPYLTDPDVGRIRHVYVHPAYRSAGVGRDLVLRLVEQARLGYSRVRLRAGVQGVGSFYESLGFATTSEPDATHTLDL